jgi:4-hydroxy-2-oxoheptanedioate aldolase
MIGAPAAQKSSPHFNRAIEKFAAGKAAFGMVATDRSLEYAQSVSRSNLDWVMLDMEHGSMDIERLRTFLIGMTDIAEVLKKGTPQPNVTPIVRLPQYGREPLDFMVKQVLDIGVFGIVFPTVDSREQALNAVRAMRYPQRKGSPISDPLGLRGHGNANAVWFWGVPTAEYERRADLWPLNRDGDLLAIMMIESVEGLRHIDEIAAVPGVGGILIGPGDLAYSIGVGGDPAALASGELPEVENAFQAILKACVARKVPCGTTSNVNNVAKRLQEGFRFFSMQDRGLSTSVESVIRVGRAAEK